jgi:hypothetical protein
MLTAMAVSFTASLISSAMRYVQIRSGHCKSETEAALTVAVSRLPAGVYGIPRQRPASLDPQLPGIEDVKDGGHTYRPA